MIKKQQAWSLVQIFSKTIWIKLFGDVYWKFLIEIEYKKTTNDYTYKITLHEKDLFIL